MEKKSESDSLQNVVALCAVFNLIWLKREHICFCIDNHVDNRMHNEIIVFLRCYRQERQD